MPTGSIADVRRILTRSKPQRFPMYIRNMKQLLRQTEPGFDERRYGFSNLVDLLRALQRDGMLRLERDRQGALRVFQGSAWTQAPQHVEPAQPVEVAPDYVDAVEATEDVVPVGLLAEEPASGAASTQMETAAPEPATVTEEAQQRRRRRPRKARATSAPPKTAIAEADAPKTRKGGRTKSAKTAAPKAPRRRTSRKASPQVPVE
jgi:hypothetical protein